VTLAEVGAYLLGVWGLPFSTVESVAFHHRPSAVSVGLCQLSAAVHAADAFVSATESGTTPDFDRTSLRARIDPDAAECKALLRTELQALRRQV